MFTVAPEKKLVPESVIGTAVPRAPLGGLIDVRVGVGAAWLNVKVADAG